MRVRRWLAVGVCVAVLAGCTTSKPEPTPSPTVSATPTPSPSPTPTEKTATDLSDEELGIIFVDTPDLTGPAASAHDAVAIYQKEFWRSQSTGTMSPLIAPLVSPTVLEKLESSLQRNVENGWRVAGTLRIGLSDVTVADTAATALVCKDYSDVRFIQNGGTPQTWDQIGFQQFELVEVSLATPDGGVTWRPEDFTGAGSSC